MSTSPSIAPRRKYGPQTTKDPKIILPRYQDQLRLQLPSSPPGTDTVSLSKPSISSIGTQLSGKRAEDVTWKIGQSFRLDPNNEYPYAINENEDGELEWFSVALNHEDLFVVCICFDEDNNPTVVCDDNMKSLAANGRGMTTGEAESTDHNGVTLDKGCRPHPVSSFLARSKHTFSRGHLSEPYETVEGTVFDKRYVIEYAPVRRAQPYKRIFFTIQNRGTETKMIHEATVKRVAYTNKYELVVSDEIQDVTESRKTPIGFKP